MEILVMNRQFESVGIIDSFSDLIWTDRYNSYGDFEIKTVVSKENLDISLLGFYLYLAESEHIMFLEDVEITSDVDDGDYLLLTGRSLESMLDRRIIWNQTTLNGNFQLAIKRLITENVISPSISERAIRNFIFEESVDPKVTALTISEQLTGDNLYGTIEIMCMERAIGFKILLNDQNQFVFSLYAGKDRSYDQTENPYVIFSPGFENIVNSNYLESNRALKNVALVAGEGEGSARIRVTVGSASDLDRRELYVDARDLSTEDENGNPIPMSTYNAMLEQRGNEDLSENKYINSFEGDVETTQAFIYGIDFFMGDIVQIVNEYDIEAVSRVGEMIFSQNKEGIKMVPTFSIVQ